MHFDSLLQLQHAVDGKTSLFENVNIDWLLIQDDYVDFSDDDLDTVSAINQSDSKFSWCSAEIPLSLLKRSPF